MRKQAKTISLQNIFFLLLVFLFAIIAYRILYISNSKVVDGTNMQTFIANRNIKKTILYANRGSILDYNGEKLARNVNAYTVIAYLDEGRTTKLSNPKHVVEKEMTAEKLSPLINMSKENILKLLEKKAYQVELRPGGKDITELVKQQIQALDLPGIDFIKGSKRDYPNSQFASYIIGYAKKNDDEEIIGEMGIENYFNDQLKGIDGYKEFQKDIHGYQIPDTPFKEIKAQSGNDIYLTIDSNVQIFLENALNTLVEKHTPEWGILTVMDAKTGAIVGSATSPTFDPNKRNIKNYNNPLTSYTFEPGSTMKIFSYMAAMENGVYKGDEKYKTGTIKVADATIKDYNTTGWGTITFDKGFPYSSNIAATLLGRKLGVRKLEEYYKKLGFGKKTDIELSGELSGIINFKYEVELANASFGQGITVTPIQMLQAMTAVTNNGILLKPYIIDKIVNPNTNEVVFSNSKKELGVVASLDTVKHIKDLMDETVNGDDPNITGGGFKTDVITVIGKTGTAQIVGKNGKYLTGKYDYVRSFIGAFPKENPEYIVYIATNKLIGYNQNLGVTIKEIVENISKNKYLSDQETDNTKNNQYIMPLLINKTIEEGKTTINEYNSNVEIIGDGEVIIDQYPKASTAVYKDHKVFLLTNGKNVIMPNIIGWSSNEVVTYSRLVNIKYKLNDYGFVVNSSFKEGEQIDINEILIVDLKPK